jgi:hypothetical protein
MLIVPIGNIENEAAKCKEEIVLSMDFTQSAV